MVLLPKINEADIVDNLKRRYLEDQIFVSFMKTMKQCFMMIFEMIYLNCKKFYQNYNIETKKISLIPTTDIHW